jgi:hypothetical protein
MSDPVKHPISPLQARMTEDMTARKLSPKTQAAVLAENRFTDLEVKHLGEAEIA